MHFKKMLFLLFLSILFIGLNFQNISANYHHDHEAHEKFKKQYEKLNAQQKKEVNQIFVNLHKNLHDLGVDVSLPHFIEKEQKKESIKKIVRDIGNGTTKVADAEKQIDALFKRKSHHHHNPLHGLDDKKQKEAKIIFDLMKRGEITKEEGRKELAKLGVKLPEKKKLNKSTKDKANRYITDAKKKLKKYNLELPEEMYKHALE